MKTTFALAVLSCIALSGCQSSTTIISPPESSLQSYISDLSCDASYQCKVIGVGERAACGGPSKYLVFSTKSLDEEVVDRLAAEETAKERILNERNEIQDSCKQVLPIQSLCVKNACQSFPIGN